MKAPPAAQRALLLQRLVWLEPLWVLVAGAVLTLLGYLFPSRAYPYLLAGLYLYWPLRWLAYGRLTRRTPIDLSVLLLMAWLAVALWVSTGGFSGWVAAGHLLFGVALYYALINWMDGQRRPEAVALALVAGATLLMFLTPFITEWKSEARFFQLAPIYDLLGTWSFFGETIHSNILAGFLVMLIPLYAAVTLRWNWPQQQWLRVVAGCLALTALVLLLLTQSRGGYLATAASLSLLLALNWPRLFLFAPVLALLALVALLWKDSATLLRFLTSDSALGGLNVRVDLWDNSLAALTDFGFTGIGIGTFAEFMPLLYQFSEASIHDPSFVHAHNLYLQIGLDLGLPGLIAWLACLLGIVALLIGVIRGPKADAAWPLAAGVLAAITGILIHGLLDAATWNTNIAFFVWSLFALAVLLGEPPSPAPGQGTSIRLQADS